MFRKGNKVNGFYSGKLTNKNLSVHKHQTSLQLANQQSSAEQVT